LQRRAADVTEAMAKAVLTSLLVLAVTTMVITWPVRRLTAGAKRLASGDLSTRVRRGGAGEVDALAVAFNQNGRRLTRRSASFATTKSQLEQRSRRRTQQLQHLAGHDPSRTCRTAGSCSSYLGERIAAANGVGERLAVLFLDLDNFKTVNDSLGHEFGDRVSRNRRPPAPAERDRRLHRRLGGDEFTLVFPVLGLGRRDRCPGPACW